MFPSPANGKIEQAGFGNVFPAAGYVRAACISVTRVAVELLLFLYNNSHRYNSDGLSGQTNVPELQTSASSSTRVQTAQPRCFSQVSRVASPLGFWPYRPS